MIAGKHITKFTAVLMAIAVLFCLTAGLLPERLTGALGGGGVSMEYEDRLFNTDEIISIDVNMEQSDWDEMLANASSEEYYACDVVINGQTFSNVGIRPKGNTSLSAIVSDPDTDRFSFKLEFDHFVDGQTCYGLDKLILNNNYADATNMKEAVTYDMFQYLGATASLYNYASVSLNGEYKGVYLALEGVEKSFMLRNFGTRDGELYKPDSMEVGGGGDGGPGPMKEGAPPFGKEGEGFNPEDMPDMEGFDPENMPDMDGSASAETAGMEGTVPMDTDDMEGSAPADTAGIEGTVPADTMAAADGGSPEGNAAEGEGRSGMRGGPSMGGKGSDLNYTDDDPDSYTTIWEGALSDTSDADHNRVIKALKNISEGTDLEKYLNVDNVLKYMAVHAFSVNMDSLSGNMAHNYYLYEYNGMLDIFPWDYNLSFGGMGSGRGGDSSGATDVVNDAIDTPFDGTDFFDALLENEEYLARYHEYLRILSEEYVDGGRFDELYSRIRSRIDELVKTDPTAFYSYDEYDAAAEALYDVIKLRAQSIEGQLDGTIPSTDEGQKNDGSALIDASEIDLSLLGSFNMGGVTGSKAGMRRGGRPRNFDEGMRGGNEQARSAGTDQASAGGEVMKNLFIYGACLGGMIIMLFSAMRVRRRRI
ncbi:MAG: CotH kinase family protein [Lachnospiraceae bacterium]|nr:CotH kinase family protein [Lachnospiraceae bacterium]